MPYELIIDVVPPGGGRVEVTHIFRGETEEEARAVFAAHADGCNFLGPAIAEERIEEELEEIEDHEWPEWDEGGEG